MMVTIMMISYRPPSSHADPISWSGVDEGKVGGAAGHGKIIIIIIIIIIIETPTTIIIITVPAGHGKEE